MGKSKFLALKIQFKSLKKANPISVTIAHTLHINSLVASVDPDKDFFSVSLNAFIVCFDLFDGFFTVVTSKQTFSNQVVIAAFGVIMLLCILIHKSDNVVIIDKDNRIGVAVQNSPQDFDSLHD